ncbi:Methionine aminotransferase, PLP-dependent / Glutamine-dependent 2-keto-4-methylthiobutyrate transaminase [Citrobacter freundii]|uniref:Methionine aminotransferase, PLP-dependent / Glutamine-dependent 2-keto-4-methylthiobutyrate transaminase n=1 Tax=Citrobacter freundii TaxID=546 RepID=A0A7G2IH69_CITFR|nr:Methionine aminotransferase, PLP-dependent / Glutamine-dependent 2-keto-4-methylthiobutyrate transaminase [Citrobacter freundii]
MLVNALRDSRLEILPCEGTYFLLVDYSAVSTLNDVEFCQWLTTEVGVAVIPLSVFCADPFPHKTDSPLFCQARIDAVNSS